MAPGRAARERPHDVPRAGGAHAPRERLARLVHGGAQRAARTHPRRAARRAREVAVLATARAGCGLPALSTPPTPSRAPRGSTDVDPRFASPPPVRRTGR